MNKVKLFIAAFVLMGAVAFGLSANTAEAATKCEVNVVTPVNLSNYGANITNTSRSATAKFKVTGDKTCKKTMTMSAWKLPNETGLPLEKQVFFGSTTKTFGVGTHTISTAIPNCYWQVDLLEGNRPKSVNGDANYVWGKDRLMDFDLGGKEECNKPQKPVKPVEKPKTPIEKPVIVPVEEVEEPKEEVKAEVTPKELPATGPAAVAATFMGISASAGAAHAIVRRFKK